MEFYLLLNYVKIRFKKGGKKVLHKKGQRHLRGKGYNWSVVVFLNTDVFTPCPARCDLYDHNMLLILRSLS